MADVPADLPHPPHGDEPAEAPAADPEVPGTTEWQRQNAAEVRAEQADEIRDRVHAMIRQYLPEDMSIEDEGVAEFVVYATDGVMEIAGPLIAERDDWERYAGMYHRGWVRSRGREDEQRQRAERLAEDVSRAAEVISDRHEEITGLRQRAERAEELAQRRGRTIDELITLQNQRADELDERDATIAGLHRLLDERDRNYAKVVDERDRLREAVDQVWGYRNCLATAANPRQPQDVVQALDAALMRADGGESDE